MAQPSLEEFFIRAVCNCYIFYDHLYFSTLFMSILLCFISSDYQLCLTGRISGIFLFLGRDGGPVEESS